MIKSVRACVRLGRTWPSVQLEFVRSMQLTHYQLRTPKATEKLFNLEWNEKIEDMPQAAFRTINRPSKPSTGDAKEFSFDNDCEQDYDDEHEEPEPHEKSTEVLNAWNLALLLRITENEANELIKFYPELAQQKLNRAKELKNKWTQVGMDETVIHEHPWLLLRFRRFANFCVQKLKEFSLVRCYDISTVPRFAIGPLFGAFPWKRIEYHLIQYDADKRSNALDFLKNFNERVTFYEQILQMSKYRVIKLALRHSPMFVYEFERIKEMHSILQESGVTAEDIRNDLWLFRHSTELARKRSDLCRSIGLSFKTWMIRCPESTFKRTVEIHNEKRQVFGDCKTTEEYLMNKLDCSDIDVKEMAVRNSLLPTVRPKKLESMIDLLLSYDISTEAIIKHPRVLSKSLDTTRKRLDKLVKLKQLDDCYSLTLDEQTFKSRFK